jgi:hypothetical protein
MSYQLYKNDMQAAQARRVTLAAQRGLASPATLCDLTRPTGRTLRVAPETLAGTIALWSQYYAEDNRRLHERAVALVEDPCRRHGIAIEMLGEYPLFRGLKVVRGRTSDVVIVPADADPLLISGKFPLPRHTRRRMEALRKAGVPFDSLYTYVAHEVPRNSVPATGPLPLAAILPPVPQTSLRTSRSLGVVAQALTASVLGGMGQVARTGVRGTGLVGAGIDTLATVLLDPLIFGAIADERGMATWFVLAQWAW